jgi:hypothetical protein
MKALPKHGESTSRNITRFLTATALYLGNKFVDFLFKKHYGTT